MPLRWPRRSELLELLGGPPLFAGLYWYTFFAMAAPQRASSGEDAFVCGHLASMWLMFTMQGTVALALACILLAATRSLVVRAWRQATARARAR